MEFHLHSQTSVTRIILTLLANSSVRQLFKKCAYKIAQFLCKLFS